MLQKGRKVILASGRPIPGVTKIAQILQLEKVSGYILSYNGGLIVDCKTEK